MIFFLVGKNDGNGDFKSSLIIMIDEHAIVLVEDVNKKLYMTMLNLRDKRYSTVESVVDMTSRLEVSGYDRLFNVLNSEVGFESKSILVHAIKNKDIATTNIIEELSSIIPCSDDDTDLTSFGSTQGKMILRDGAMAFVVKHTKDGLKRKYIRQTLISVVKGLEAINIEG